MMPADFHEILFPLDIALKSAGGLIQQDWSGKIPDTMVVAPCSATGLKAEKARALS
jgi:hypothetical protein